MHKLFTGFIQSPDWICFILFVGDLYMEACFTSTHIHIFVVQSTLYSLQCGAYTHKYTLIKQRLNPFQPHWTGSDCVESDSLFRHKVFLKFDLNLDFTVAVMRGFNPDNKQTPKSRINSNCIKLLAFWLTGTGREIENHIPVLREGTGIRKCYGKGREIWGL